MEAVISNEVNLTLVFSLMVGIYTYCYYYVSSYSGSIVFVF